MKTLITATGTLFFAMTAMAAPSESGAGFKLALVDLQKALQSVEAGKSAKSQLEKAATDKRQELEKIEKGLRSEAEQFEKKAAIMSDSAKAQKSAEFQKRVAEYQKNAAESEMDLRKRERELTQPLIQELKVIIEGIGKEKDYNLVLEKNEGAVLYAANATDLTENVVERFNSRHKGKGEKKK